MLTAAEVAAVLGVSLSTGYAVAREIGFRVRSAVRVDESAVVAYKERNACARPVQAAREQAADIGVVTRRRDVPRPSACDAVPVRVTRPRTKPRAPTG